MQYYFSSEMSYIQNTWKFSCFIFFLNYCFPNNIVHHNDAFFYTSHFSKRYLKLFYDLIWFSKHPNETINVSFKKKSLIFDVNHCTCLIDHEVWVDISDGCLNLGWFQSMLGGGIDNLPSTLPVLRPHETSLSHPQPHLQSGQQER